MRNFLKQNETSFVSKVNSRMNNTLLLNDATIVTHMYIYPRSLLNSLKLTHTSHEVVELRSICFRLPAEFFVDLITIGVDDAENPRFATRWR